MLGIMSELFGSQYCFPMYRLQISFTAFLSKKSASKQFCLIRNTIKNRNWYYCRNIKSNGYHASAFDWECKHQMSMYVPAEDCKYQSVPVELLPLRWEKSSWNLIWWSKASLPLVQGSRLECLTTNDDTTYSGITRIGCYHLKLHCAH